MESPFSSPTSGIHLFPTAIVFLSCIGLFEVAVSSSFTPWVMVLGMGIGCVGVAFEFVADNQLAAFRHRKDPHPEDVLDTGLWGFIRYPNYLGEMLFWWGVAVWFGRGRWMVDGPGCGQHDGAVCACIDTDERQTHGVATLHVPVVQRAGPRPDSWSLVGLSAEGADSIFDGRV